MATNYPRMISSDSHIFESTDLLRKALGNKFGDEIPHELSEYR